ncbi:hypothetical protein K8O68_09985 [Salipaludibacillus sp. CUR1]|uniref:hypothetical protein n=1 Tax=Salipaludibacillus sp. CUR1 TaxID=2820003 RepID=UPI001E344CCA|nr:hypothetical protein [Salipaludibacillus sp. CUR1]MCE7792744.1 hypothetical protein [Salipaludibacillus sp. CUR1]
MNNKFLKILAVGLVMVFIFNTIAPLGVSAKEHSDAKEVAEQLEFIFEEAAIKDVNGKIIGLDIDMIEEKYGTSTELDQLKQEMNAIGMNQDRQLIEQSQQENLIMPNMLIIDFDEACMRSEFNSFIADYSINFAFSTFYQYMLDKEYYKAAKRLIKAGVKGSPWAIAASLTQMAWKCS